MYKVQLELFEGPLDLLLFFIKRDEIDIYDIPIATITGEYLEYVNLIQLLDLETAGDFILMASILMHIKVRMLLPREINEQGKEIDPRDELVARLLEYKRYKEMSEDLGFLESSQRKISFRGYYDEDPSESFADTEKFLKNITVFDLAKAYKKVMDQQKPEIVHEIKKVSVSIDEQIDFIKDKLKEFGELHFMSLIINMREKIRVVVTFIALLELTKNGEIGIRESSEFNDFVVYNI